MSSGFVPASDSTATASNDKPDVPVNDEWEAAKASIEQRRRERENASQPENQKSLFETLQANKAAKQDAFEESIRLKNQFRSLDEDEVEFLDSVLESTRKKEQEVKKETSEMLELFRKQQEDADKATLLAGEEGKTADEGGAGSPTLAAEAGETWEVTSKKRKKGSGKDKEGVLKGVKIRRTSSSAHDEREGGGATNPVTGGNTRLSGDGTSGRPPASAISTSAIDDPVSSTTKTTPVKKAADSPTPNKSSLGGILGLGYDSDTSD